MEINNIMKLSIKDPFNIECTVINTRDYKFVHFVQLNVNIQKIRAFYFRKKV